MGSIAELRGHVATPADTISDTFSCLLAAKWTRADTYGHEWTRSDLSPFAEGKRRRALSDDGYLLRFGS